MDQRHSRFSLCPCSRSVRDSVEENARCSLNPEIADRFIWKLSPNQQYSAACAYRAFFHGQCAISGAKELSKMIVPARCKFFIWLALLDRCWTSDHRQHHNLDSNGLCAFCDQATETISHLLLSCAYSKEVWFRVLRRPGFHYLALASDQLFVDWWVGSRKRIHKSQRKGFDTLFALVCWSLCKERNARVFDRVSSPPARLSMLIKEEAPQWVAAGYTGLVNFLC
jgi:hypothetical protein